MNASFDVVCCSLEDWDDVWRRSQFIVRELLDLDPNCRVLFVEPPRDVVHELRRRHLTPPRSTLRSIAGSPRLWAFKPVKIWPRVAGPRADVSLAAQVKRTARELGFDQPLLWVNDAAYATLAGQVTWPTLYDITDDWLLAEAAPREIRRRQHREESLLSRAQEVVVCSPGLAASRNVARPVGTPVRLIANAVDASRYAEPAARPADLPSSPVAVYVGTLHRDRLDVELVLRAAHEAPTLQFAFVGPIDLGAADLERLRARPNVHLLGARPWDAVPAYLQHASVLMVPHIVSRFTESLDPIKAYEYLASGRPVVSTPVAGFRDIEAPQMRSVAPDDFAGALVAMASGETRFDAPPLPSWRDRATAFRDALVDARDRAAARRVRVVYLDHSAQLSGAELALARLLPALTGVDPTVVLAETGPLRDRLERDGVSTEVLALGTRTQSLRRDRVRPGRVPLGALWDSARYVTRLRRRLRELAPDLVHTNSLKAALYGSLAGRLAGVPVICHVRDRIASDYLPRPAVIGVRMLLRRAPAALIANSAATMETVASHRNSSPRAVVHDIVDPPPVVTRPPAGTRFCIGMVGRLAPWKGQHVFLEAFARAFAGTDARALIVGAAMFGEAEYEREIHSLVAQLGISDQVEFVGFVDDVYASFALMHVVVHASVTAEPFGQVVAEAMAAGVPVIATAAGGPLEIIEANVTGLLVPPDDTAALAAAMIALHDDPAMRARLAGAASETVDRFAPAEIARQVQLVYDQITK